MFTCPEPGTAGAYFGENRPEKDRNATGFGSARPKQKIMPKTQNTPRLAQTAPFGRRECLNLEPVTFVVTYAASLPLGNAESSRAGSLQVHDLWSPGPNCSAENTICRTKTISILLTNTQYLRICLDSSPISGISSTRACVSNCRICKWPIPLVFNPAIILKLRI